MNITPGSREEKNSLSFLDHLAGMGGYKLRPLNYLVLEQIALLELKLASGKEARESMTPADLSDEINVYFFLQAAPLPVVSRAVRRFRSELAATDRATAFETLMVEAVEPFLATLSADDKADLVEQLGTLDEVDAARVEAAPPKGGKRERHDPNSSSQEA